MEGGTLEDIGSINLRACVREEKWSSSNMKQLKFPECTVSSMKRAAVIQHFEADFIRAMGIINPSAALYARAVIAGVQRDLQSIDDVMWRPPRRTGPSGLLKSSGIPVVVRLQSTYNYNSLEFPRNVGIWLVR